MLLRRHELALDEAPELISFPRLALQLEQLLTMCISLAVTTRIEKFDQKPRTVGAFLASRARYVARTVGNLLGFDERPWMQEPRESRLLLDGDRTHTAACVSALRHTASNRKPGMFQPVTCEEVHVALMHVVPLLLDSADGEVDLLDSFARRGEVEAGSERVAKKHEPALLRLMRLAQANKAAAREAEDKEQAQTFPDPPAGCSPKPPSKGDCLDVPMPTPSTPSASASPDDSARSINDALQTNSPGIDLDDLENSPNLPQVNTLFDEAARSSFDASMPLPNSPGVMS